MDFDAFSLNQVQEFLRKQGKKGKIIIDSLSRLYPHMTVLFNSEVGKELFALDLASMDELMTKIYKEEASPQEIAEFRYLRDKRMPMLRDLVDKFINQVNEVKKTVNG